jgi:hypothetical protein
MHSRKSRWLSVSALGLALAATPLPSAWAQAKPKPGAKEAAASAPTVSVAGLRVVLPGLGEQGTEVRAFNEAAGTTLALLVKPGSGAGIVEINNEKSVLSSLKDDTGADLMEEARFGPFGAKIAKDGSAAITEVATRARPSPGATSLSAEGSIAATSSTGTKVVKVPGVVLAAGKTFKVGTGIVTIGDASPRGDQVGVTFKLTSALLQTIREIRFKDASGAVAKSSWTGRGIFGDQGEISYAVPSTLKTATVELDVWQNLKEITIPFTLKIGLALK